MKKNNKKFSQKLLLRGSLAIACTSLVSATAASCSQANFIDDSTNNGLQRFASHFADHITVAANDKISNLTAAEFDNQNRSPEYSELQGVVVDGALPNPPANTIVQFTNSHVDNNQITYTFEVRLDNLFKTISFTLTNFNLKPNDEPNSPTSPPPSDETTQPVDPQTKLNNVNRQSTKNAFTLPQSSQNILPESEIFQNLYDRTFSIAFQGLPPGSTKDTDTVINASQGTGWVLDYAWNPDHSKLMLYLATNAHVYGPVYNPPPEKYQSNFPEYFNDNIASASNNTTIKGFALGKAGANVNLNPLPNKTNPLSTNQVHFFHNLKFASQNTSTASQNTFLGDIISNPKTIFMAIDFFQDNDNQKLLQALRNTDPSINYFGKDFAVFGVEINYAKLQDGVNANLSGYVEFKQDIDKALNAFDFSQNRFKTVNVPNHNTNDLPYLSVDYGSIYHLNPNNISLRNRPDFFNYYSNTRQVYLGGYPNLNGPTVYLHNHSSDLPKPTNGVFNHLSFGSTSETVEFFGHKFTKIDGAIGFDNASLYFGASGSLVANEYGLPIGIYTNFAPFRQDGNTDLSQRSFLAFLIKPVDEFLTFFGSQLSDPIVYAHNLIDGTNKKLYPHQTKSYRQNLEVLKDEFAGFTNTALFPNGI
ncbi:DUF31 family putative serine protease [[Mycoplasma] testudinis]|uniref:DUF31 family putative serine protease n=1 Tax=[Mycoplasma] testudinis TaxID=33924 RepID=UPI000481F4C9|nr:hypothetical protein [[Mycoplasma] testudinis]